MIFLSSFRESLGRRLLKLVSNGGYLRYEALALIAAGADVCVKDYNGGSILHWAAGYGHTDIALALIKKGVDVNARNDNGATALHWATWDGRTAVARALIENGAEIGAKDDRGTTALHWAAEYGHSDTVTLLIEKGADISAKRNDGYTAEMLARRGSYTVLADRILTVHFERATRGFKKGLEHAIPAPAPLRVKKRSFAPMTQTPETPESLGLRLLKIIDEKDKALALIAAGADVRVKDDLGWTPLHLAAQFGYTAVARALMEKGAEPGEECNDGNTPLHLAARSGNTTIAIALVEKGAKIDAKNIVSDTALHWAARYGQTDTLLALIQRSAKIDAQNKDGDTPLHLAVWYAPTHAALALIENGADIGVKNNNSDTAETLAREIGKTALADRIPAAHFERATRAFRTGLKDDLHVPPPLRMKKRNVAP